MITLSTHTPQFRSFNLRKELARCLWLARKNTLNILEAQDNCRSLVALCPEPILDLANHLLHAVFNQIQKIYGRHYFKKNGLNHRQHIQPIATRSILWLGNIPDGYLG
jgi:hypothetical protein